MLVPQNKLPRVVAQAPMSTGRIVPANKLPKVIQSTRIVPSNKIAQSAIVPKSKLPSALKQESGGLWRGVVNQLVKPVASASNALEDLGKTIAYPIANALKPGSFEEYSKKVGIDPIQHQKDVWSGNNQRTYSTIMNEIADSPDNVQNVPLSTAMRTTGYGGDFILDPLNKVKILEATAKGREAMKTGKMALSAADQAAQGQRALLQFGNTNILPSIGNRALAASTKANDYIRSTKIGAGAIDALSNLSTAIRPSGINREEFKTLQDATRAFKKSTGYANDQAIKLAAEMEKSLRKQGADEATRSALLHAVEKGDETLVPKGLEDIYQKATAFKNANEEAWKQAGGATLEDYGLPHVATDAVAEQARKDALKASGSKIYSSTTPQDVHREWVKVDGQITKIKDAGVTYDKKSGQYMAGKQPVQVEQATAREINDSLRAQGKEPIFKEDLPTAIARGGISTGRKVAGEEFLRATADIKSDPALAIVNETYKRLTNHEALNKAIQLYDKALGVWKSQVLVAPSYHVRNEVGNLWNNFMAGTSPLDYANAAKIQGQMAIGKLDDASAALVKEMEQQGITGGSQYGKDITQTIADQLGGTRLNPFKQNFGVYKANFAVGKGFEDNARMALYLAKRREGYNPVEAGKIVDKFLFDYGDLTFIEQNILRRVLPFYTWTRKNIPLQLEQFVKNPGKFSNAATAQRDWEKTVSKPEERYMSDFLKNNSPMRISTAADGTTQYLLLGQWIPAAQAIQFLSQPSDEIARGVLPLLSIGQQMKDVILNEHKYNESFFKDTLGNPSKIENTPGELGSFLGFDMSKKMKNLLSGIRVLNEIDKLNPGEIFGGKGKPSIFQGMTPNASETRGTQNSPDSTQASRTLAFLLGKTQNYDVENAKNFYDKDTQRRMDEYSGQLNQALKLNQPDLAKNIIQEMEQFQSDRAGAPNKNIQNYNLMGDQYFTDLAQQKAAEFKQKDTREKMREMIRQGITTGNNDLVKQALTMDPAYSKQAVTDALKEKATSQMSPEQQKMMYDVEKLKTQKRLQSYY